MQKGIFIDGLLYKTVAFNYSQGDGSFWRMKFTNVSMNPFYEQPPLYFFINGLFYKIFGASLFADRFFTLTLLLFNLVLFKKISKILFEQNQTLFIILILFLLSVQVLCWSFVNQMIETLVLLFVVLALFLFLKSMKQSMSQSIIYSFLFGLCIPLLFLTKGFQSCFVIVLPFFHSVLFRSKQSFRFFIIASLVATISLGLLLFQHPPSSEWFSHYFQKRLLASLNNVGATTDNHFEIIFRTFSELIFPIVLIVVLYVRFRTLKVNPDKIGFVLLLTAVAGSFPFAVTLEQRGFYLVPSFPFYILGTIVIFKEHLGFFYLKMNDFFSKKFMAPAIYLIFSGSVLYLALSFTIYKRDENLIRDLAVLKEHLPENDTVSILEETWNNVPLHGYLYMSKKLNLEVNTNHAYLIHDRSISEKPDSNYKKIELNTLQYDLYINR